MITINVSDNIKDITRGLDDFARQQVPFATAQALTFTARNAAADLKRELGSVFDRPTPFIANSPFFTAASKSRLEATVGIRDKGGRATPAQYLKEHFDAGARGNKPMEKALRAAGYLPAGWLAIPSNDGVKKDAFGNVSRATVARILGALKQGTTARQGASAFRLFVVPPGDKRKATRHLAPGIWSANRVGDSMVLKPVFLFVQAARYEKVLDLQKTVGATVQREFARQFGIALSAAIRTAR